MEIAEIRAKFPQYKDMSDGELVRGLHKAHYSDMPYEQFLRSIDFREPQKPVQGAWGSDSAIEAQRMVQDRPWGSGTPEFSKELGGKVVDLSSNMGASPETAAALGQATNITTQAIPALFGGSVMGGPAVPAMQNAGRSLMRSAAKPPLNAGDDAARGIESMLREGYNPTAAGAEFARKASGNIEKEVQALLAASPETIGKVDAAKNLGPLYARELQGPNWAKARDVVGGAWDDFRNIPSIRGKTDIPVDEANRIKQAYYASIGGQNYGEVSGLATEAQKQLARGIREGVAAKVPAVAPRLSRQGDFIEGGELAARRASVSANRDPLGFAAISPTAGGAAAFLLNRWDEGKALLARGLYSGARPAAQAAGSAAIAGPELYKRNVDAEKEALARALRENQ